MAWHDWLVEIDQEQKTKTITPIGCVVFAVIGGILSLPLIGQVLFWNRVLEIRNQRAAEQRHIVPAEPASPRP